MSHISHVSQAKSCVRTPQALEAKPATSPAKVTLASLSHTHLLCLQVLSQGLSRTFSLVAISMVISAYMHLELEASRHVP
jgi:hypothetical protein